MAVIFVKAWNGYAVGDEANLTMKEYIMAVYGGYAIPA